MQRRGQPHPSNFLDTGWLPVANQWKVSVSSSQRRFYLQRNRIFSREKKLFYTCNIFPANDDLIFVSQNAQIFLSLLVKLFTVITNANIVFLFRIHKYKWQIQFENVQKFIIILILNCKRAFYETQFMYNVCKPLTLVTQVYIFWNASRWFEKSLKRDSLLSR